MRAEANPKVRLPAASLLRHFHGRASTGQRTLACHVVRVLVLTPYLYGKAPGPRSSIELWERVLKPEGITFEYAPFETERLNGIIYQPGLTGAKVREMVRAYMRRIPLMRRLDEFDAVLVYREAALIGPELFERWVARTGRPIIYQLDDPLYVPYRSPSNSYLSYLKVFGKVGRIAGLSSVTIVNSRQHREYVAKFTQEIALIPSLVDGDRFSYRPATRSSGDPVCIGWSGSSSTSANLRVVQNSLRSLSERSDVRLHFIGSDRFDLPGVRHTCQRWDPDSEIEDLRQFDIGLLPLPVDEWTKRKFYLKLVQYMALGIPAVCTPLGANPEVVEHGQTGFLANNDNEWSAALERLVADSNLRAEMGRVAAERAHERYTLQANASAIVDAFRRVARQTPSTMEP